jgi:release factor glutamine methyltransferase
MTNSQLEKQVYEQLLPVYGRNEALSMQRFLFSALHGKPDHEWLLHRNAEVSEALKKQIENALPLLLNQMPVQYVVGKTWFCDLELFVEPGVLIPRPETEELVREIFIKHQLEKSLEILDIGTGSGAIALAISSKLPFAKVSAIDFSEKALAISAKNAQNLNLTVNIFKADILNQKDYCKFGKYNIIVSNPPYVKESEKEEMQRNVIDYEPFEALFVSDSDPLVFYRAITGFAASHLLEMGEVWFEINESEAGNVAMLLTKSGFGNVRIYNDFKGKERFVSGILNFSKQE